MKERIIRVIQWVGFAYSSFVIPFLIYFIRKYGGTYPESWFEIYRAILILIVVNLVVLAITYIFTGRKNILPWK